MTQMTWLNHIMEAGNSDAWQSFRKSKAQILRAGFAIVCLQLLAIWFWFFHAAAVVLLFGQPQSLLSFAFSLSQIWVVITAVAAVVPQSCFIIPESARRLYQMLKIIPWPCHLNVLYDVGWLFTGTWCNQSFSLTTRWWAQSVQTRLLEKSVDIIYDFFGLRGRASSEIEGVRMMTLFTFFAFVGSRFDCLLHGRRWTLRIFEANMHSISEIYVRDLSS